MAEAVADEASAGGASPDGRRGLGRTVFPVLAAVSFCHFLNDALQSVIPAVYPILKSAYHLDFGRIGLIIFAF